MINIDKGSVKFGTSFVEGVKQTLGQTYEAVKEAVPIVGQVEEFYAGSEERERARLLERGFTPEQIQAADVEKQQYTKTGEATSQFIQGVSDVTNIAPELVQAGAFVAESVLDARMAGRMTFDTARGAVRLMPAEPVQALTVTDPRFIAKGVAQDVAQTPKFAPAVKTYTERGQAYADAVEQVQSNLASGKISESRLKKTLAKIEKIRKGDASTFEYDPANPYAYREGIESSFNPYVSTPEYTGLRKDAPRGVVSKRAKEVQVDDPYEAGRKAQQHHILAKAETKPFADTLMDLIKKGVADEDDLVNFFVWPEQYDMFPGNVLNNLLDMGEITHTVAKKDPMALHKILKEAGLEFGAGTEKQIIKNYGLDKVTNTNELMQAYDRYLQEIAIPSKEITYKVHDMWYDKTVKQLKGAELKEFKEKYSKLSDPRKNR
tara:strand:+ start:45 stop:1346 length:1302 start_codon:yes stop_codon:yes gene_type:complete